jgi:hypothetical protein
MAVFDVGKRIVLASEWPWGIPESKRLTPKSYETYFLESEDLGAWDVSNLESASITEGELVITGSPGTHFRYYTSCARLTAVDVTLVTGDFEIEASYSYTNTSKDMGQGGLAIDFSNGAYAKIGFHDDQGYTGGERFRAYIGESYYDRTPVNPATVKITRVGTTLDMFLNGSSVKSGDASDFGAIENVYLFCTVYESTKTSKILRFSHFNLVNNS